MVLGGDVVFTVDITKDKIDKIPENDTPNFEVIWRQDDITYEVEQEGVMVMIQHP